MECSFHPFSCSFYCFIVYYILIIPALLLLFFLFASASKGLLVFSLPFHVIFILLINSPFLLSEKFIGRVPWFLHCSFSIPFCFCWVYWACWFFYFSNFSSFDLSRIFFDLWVKNYAFLFTMTLQLALFVIRGEKIILYFHITIYCVLFILSSIIIWKNCGFSFNSSSWTLTLAQLEWVFQIVVRSKYRGLPIGKANENRASLVKK